MKRMYSPSPTVRSSRVPLYMRGFPAQLGQDEGDFSDFSDFDFTPPEPIIPDFDLINPVAPVFTENFPTISPLSPVQSQFQPLLDQGFSLNQAELISGAAASGKISNAQWQSIMQGNHSPSSVLSTIFGTAATVAKAATPAAPNLGPGASPRVAVSPKGQPTATPSGASIFTQQSIPGVPNWMLLAGAGIAVLAMGKR